MTIVRRLPTTFTNAADLPRFSPPLTPLPITPARRYSAQSALVAPNDPVMTLAGKGSAGGEVAAAALANAPLLKYAESRPYLSFDGVDDVMIEPTNDVIGANPYTLYGVGRWIGDIATGFAGLAGYGDQSGQQVGKSSGVSSFGKIQVYRGTVLDSAIQPGSDWRIIVVVFDGANSVIRVGNQTEVVGQAGTNSPGTGTFRLASMSTMAANTRPHVDVMEAGSYLTALTAPQRTALVAALSAQYGIAV